MFSTMVKEVFGLIIIIFASMNTNYMTVNGYPFYLLEDCEKKIESDVEIMTVPLKACTDGVIEVTNAETGIELLNGTLYMPGKILQLNINFRDQDKTYGRIYELEGGAKFEESLFNGCDDTRSIDLNPYVILPSNPSINNIVKIKAVFASKHKDTKFTNTFILYPHVGVGSFDDAYNSAFMISQSGTPQFIPLHTHTEISDEMRQLRNEVVQSIFPSASSSNRTDSFQDLIAHHIPTSSPSILSLSFTMTGISKEDFSLEAQEACKHSILNVLKSAHLDIQGKNS